MKVANPLAVGVRAGLLLCAVTLTFSASAQFEGGVVLRQGRAGIRRRVGAGAAGRVQAVLPPVIRRAIEASETLRFTGRRTVSVLKEGQPNRHEEIVMRDGPRIRIEFPEGGTYSGQVIVEVAGERRHYLPDTNEVRVLPARREEGLQRLRALFRQGGVTLETGERIAGYPTVEVAARDASGNLLQRLAIEPESGLVLRRVIYGPTGNEIGGFVYTRVDLNPGPFDPSLFKIERRGAQVTTPYDELRKRAKRWGFVPAGLPASSGFRLDTVTVAKFPEGQVLSQNYVGPGGRLSLFELQAAVSPARLRRLGKATLHTLSWTASGETFVFVGPQSEATLARLKEMVTQ